ncbi:delta6 fatty acid elongase [Neoconidiobolus thromboides FSU 785]|nr:delta6 fatty acid elongase [Neoconidiobolus thromboides FSU 785]
MNIDKLNSVCKQYNVKAAYYDLPVDIILKFTEKLSFYFSPYTHAIENVINKNSKNLIEKLESLIKTRSISNSESLPLMKLTEVFIILSIYLTIVYLLYNNDTIKKYNLRLISMVHNSFMIVISAYIFIATSLQTIHDNYTLFGNPIDITPTGIPMTKIVWLFYFSKIFEFNDTIIMLLKKNYRQVSFLHVYHHTSIFIVMWLVTLFGPNGDTYFSTILNTFIHILMYSYYLGSALKLSFVSFIKKYITIAQILQFSLNFIQASFNILDYYFFRPEKHLNNGGYPHFLSCLLLLYMISMLSLFVHFYINDRKRMGNLKDKKSN